MDHSLCDGKSTTNHTPYVEFSLDICFRSVSRQKPNLAHKQENDIKISSVVINVKKLLNFIERTANEVKLITSWTKNYPNLVNIEYENMIDDRGLLNIDIANKLSLVLGVDPFEKKKPLIVKQAKKCLSESIINYDEVKESFNGTKYEWMMLK